MLSGSGPHGLTLSVTRNAIISVTNVRINNTSAPGPDHNSGQRFWFPCSGLSFVFMRKMLRKLGSGGRRTTRHRNSHGRASSTIKSLPRILAWSCKSGAFTLDSCSPDCLERAFKINKKYSKHQKTRTITVANCWFNFPEIAVILA